VEGWPSHIPNELKPYKNQETEFSTENSCLMWGIQVVVPLQLHSQVLLIMKTLHANHPGITQMKTITRSYFWWSVLDKAIEEVRKSCHICQANQPNPSVAPLHSWVWPDLPWKHVHVDFTGPSKVTPSLLL